jgi:hypothetical protein
LKAQEKEEQLRKKFEEMSAEVKEQLGKILWLPFVHFLAVYKATKSKEIRHALRELARENIEFGEQSIEAWKELRKVLEAQTEEL